MKYIYIGSVDLVSAKITKAIEAMPPVRELGCDSKKEEKKRKKRLRELACRQKRLNQRGVV